MDAIIRLWDICGLTRPWNPPVVDYERALSCPTSGIFAHELEGRIVGTVMAGCDGHRGWLYYLATHPEFRKRGIARALVLHAEEWLRAEHNSPKSMLMIRRNNTVVHDFYLGLGYGECEVSVMEKWLNDDGPDNHK